MIFTIPKRHNEMKINKVGLLDYVSKSSHKDKVIKEKIHNIRIKDFIPELISFQQNDI